tara:strand:- start:15484 stop:16224 length:741 start_codon:yes stop_codon:yes gene_type:complete
MVNKGKIPTKTEINILKKNEAKQKLESLNLDSNGSRPELHERLMIYYHGIDSVKKEKKVKSSKKDVPCRSAIRLMKKGDIISILNELNLPTNGGKDCLVNRLDSFYRPNNKEKKQDSLKNNVLKEKLKKSLTKNQIRNMTKNDLKENLEKLGLSTNGAIIEMSKRLEEYYHPPLCSNISTKSNLPTCSIKKEVLNDKTSTSQVHVILYNGRKIGVMFDNLQVLEESSDDEWIKTDLHWDLENWCPY